MFVIISDPDDTLLTHPLIPSSQVTQSQSRGRRNIFLVNFIKIFWPFLQLYWFCHRLGRTWIEIIGANNQQLVSFMTLRGFYFWHSSIKLFKFSVDYLNMKIRNIMDHGFACQLILCCLNLKKKGKYSYKRFMIYNIGIKSKYKRWTLRQLSNLKSSTFFHHSAQSMRHNW